jgi:hypothetical protein
MQGAPIAEQVIAAPPDSDLNPVVERALAEHADEVVARYGRQNHLDRPVTVKMVYVAPKKIRAIYELCFVSGLYLRALTAFERFLDKQPRRRWRRILGILHKLALWRFDVFLLAEWARE